MKRALFFFILILPSFVFGQLKDFEKHADENLQKVDQLKEKYDTLIIKSNQYLNGKNYTYKYPIAKGHPFYGENNWVPGTIKTTNNTFENIKIKYDVLNDVLLHLYFSESGTYNIGLNPDNIESFVINDHLFIKVKNNLSPNGPGYFEVVSEGKTTLLIKRVKYLKDASGYDGSYKSSFTPYLYSEGNIIKLKSRRALLKVTGDKSDLMKKYLWQNLILLRFATEKEVIDVIQHYEQLK